MKKILSIFILSVVSLLAVDNYSVGQGNVTIALVPLTITNSQVRYISIKPTANCIMSYDLGSVTTTSLVANAGAFTNGTSTKYEVDYRVSLLTGVSVATNWTLNRTISLVAGQYITNADIIAVTNSAVTGGVLDGADQVIYTATNAVGGLTNKFQYYVIVNAATNIKLASLYGSAAITLGIGSDDIFGVSSLTVLPKQRAYNPKLDATAFASVYDAGTNFGYGGAQFIRQLHIPKNAPLQYALVSGVTYVLIISNASTEAATVAGSVKIVLDKSQTK
jgi:hypothetical protein